jgi:hypothetical protein
MQPRSDTLQRRQGEGGSGKSALLSQLAVELSSSHAWASFEEGKATSTTQEDAANVNSDVDTPASENDGHPRVLSEDEPPRNGQRVRAGLLGQHSQCLCIWYLRQTRHTYSDVLHALAQEVRVAAWLCAP